MVGLFGQEVEKEQEELIQFLWKAVWRHRCCEVRCNLSLSISTAGKLS